MPSLTEKQTKRVAEADCFVSGALPIGDEFLITRGWLREYSVPGCLDLHLITDGIPCNYERTGTSKARAALRRILKPRKTAA